MARKKKKAEQEGISAGWINTFADLMAMLISIIFLAAMRKRYHDA